MSNKIKAAFLAVAPQGNPGKDRSTIESSVIVLETIFVSNYTEAVSVAKDLVARGFEAIELCAGFGNKGVAMISEAINYKIPVGAVRFDNHPLLNNASGDEMFL